MLAVTDNNLNIENKGLALYQAQIGHSEKVGQSRVNVNAPMNVANDIIDMTLF